MMEEKEKWFVKMCEKDKKKYKVAGIMNKKDTVDNFEDAALDDNITYCRKDIIRVADDTIVVSIDGKLTTI